ncbi:predicted protein [Sclerotinia sclerotiorum 1980 UF-70]|uniref:Uncharacterized protein n=1 Tax=Sclerotinia sclerotiorum (strain ATCC 18683 / 1980 / Ss-1) TaxID=665079 RepID=A7E8U5_SCLS1|nr:predicted protein [Sclerotinia sclerotiorum 1980 UF-70]EDN96797.1 predicted protein [Sclerotinia sclerotiorum 1980 UF-70]
MASSRSQGEKETCEVVTIQSNRNQFPSKAEKQQSIALAQISVSSLGTSSSNFRRFNLSHYCIAASDFTLKYLTYLKGPKHNIKGALKKEAQAKRFRKGNSSIYARAFLPFF